MSAHELGGAIEIVPGRLFYVALRATPRNTTDAHFFSTDNELVYWNFFLDFGPLNLGQLFRFCQQLNAKLNDRRLAGKRIYYYSGTHAHRRTNSVFLLCAWTCLFLERSAEEAYAPFRGIYPPFPPFHDASPCICTFNVTVLDCLKGMCKAISCGFFNFETFDVEEYEYFEKVENGDLNWITSKFICFAGPHYTRNAFPDGYMTLTPDDYIPYFQKRDVQLVVRLNKKYYDEGLFVKAGIDHKQIYFLDGSTPPERLLLKFLESCEAVEGNIAVHCKAGLGRAGTCTGCYNIKHHGFSAAEWIGWNRICRPGSIIGPQQHFLKEMEQTLWRAGDLYRAQRAELGLRATAQASVSRGLGSLALEDHDAAGAAAAAAVGGGGAGAGAGAGAKPALGPPRAGYGETEDEQRYHANQGSNLRNAGTQRMAAMGGGGGAKAKGDAKSAAGGAGLGSLLGGGARGADGGGAGRY